MLGVEDVQRQFLIQICRNRRLRCVMDFGTQSLIFIRIFEIKVIRSHYFFYVYLSLSSRFRNLAYDELFAFDLNFSVLSYSNHCASLVFLLTDG